MMIDRQRSRQTSIRREPCVWWTSTWFIALAMSSTITWAQAPSERPAMPLPPSAEADVAAQESRVIKTDPAIMAAIARALEQAKAEEAAARGEDSRSGTMESASVPADPLLQDVIETIRRRGSVLDGSSLDPRREREIVPDVAQESYVPDAAFDPARDPRQGGDQAALPSIYLVAENLLRSARQLESVAANDPGQLELVYAMRAQASRLLIQAIMQDTNGNQPPMVDGEF